MEPQPPSPFERYQELQRYVSWTPEDADRVRAIGPLMAPHFETLVDDFYAEIKRHPDALKVITGGEEQIARLKKTLVRWLEELVSGTYDRAYVERRWAVGYRHVEIGLHQVYTNAALSRLRRGLLAALQADWQGSLPDLMAARGSLITLLDLDLAIIEDAYQTEYQRRQAAAERLATIGKVAGGVAHELRNPLNVVKTSVYYLVNARNPAADKIKTHLERIERQVGVADRVITALNDFARLPLPQMEPIGVDGCLTDILENSPLPAIVTLERSLAPDLAVMGDPALLNIALGNVIRNARDAMPSGGTLRLAARADGDLVEIRVQDTGVGIPPENLPRIFEPLYSTKAKGIGLGLSIAHEIFTRHHGTLRVASEVGVGTTFTIQLPRALAPP
jgi:signal transduction histidine kinase